MKSIFKMSKTQVAAIFRQIYVFIYCTVSKLLHIVRTWHSAKLIFTQVEIFLTYPTMMYINICINQMEMQERLRCALNCFYVYVGG